MTRSLRTPGHQALMQVLVETRKSKGITQQELADLLNRPQSYIAKVETGERRLDVIEFIEWCSGTNSQPTKIVEEIVREMSNPSQMLRTEGAKNNQELEE